MSRKRKGGKKVPSTPAAGQAQGGVTGGAPPMVEYPEYENGTPLFAYQTPERVVTVALCYPEDGTPPLPLAELRRRVAEELARGPQGDGRDDFLGKMLAALDAEIAHRADRKDRHPPAA